MTDGICAKNSFFKNACRNKIESIILYLYVLLLFYHLFKIPPLKRKQGREKNRSVYQT
jgi:hypothetical protein